MCPQGANFFINFCYISILQKTPLEDELQEYISVHDSLNQLNMLASYMGGMENFDFDKLQAILSTSVANLGKIEIGSIINLLHEDNFHEFDFIYAHNAEALGRYYEDQYREKTEGLSFEEHGRNCAKEERGVFVNDGYIKHQHKEVSVFYDGMVPAEYKIVGTALRGLPPKQTEHGEKPSVLDEINASRQESHKTKAGADSKPEDRGVHKTKKDKGETDL